MATPTDTPTRDRSLEKELRELEENEAALEGRTNSLALTNILQGMIEDMDPGASGKMTLKLTPGSYVLFCNVPGHYAAGQHVRLTVTR
jgi:uncharacterized cupredoxin-like copper-binding protein